MLVKDEIHYLELTTSFTAIAQEARLEAATTIAAIFLLIGARIGMAASLAVKIVMDATGRIRPLAGQNRPTGARNDINT
jgi:hypothetical protein